MVKGEKNRKVKKTVEFPWIKCYCKKDVRIK